MKKNSAHPDLLFVHFKLARLGVPAPHNLVRQAGQLGGIEPVGLGTGPGHQLVQEGDGLLGDVLVSLVLHHAGHVAGGHVGEALLQAEVVVVRGEEGAAPALREEGDDGSSDSSSICE